jgi:hypothetical protein
MRGERGCLSQFGFRPATMSEIGSLKVPMLGSLQESMLGNAPMGPKTTRE